MWEWKLVVWVESGFRGGRWLWGWKSPNTWIILHRGGRWVWDEKVNWGGSFCGGGRFLRVVGGSLVLKVVMSVEGSCGGGRQL